MGSRALFALRVLRCPGCHARLPVKGRETVVQCEYCDVRVQLVGTKPSPQARPSRSPAPGPLPAAVREPRTTHVATPHYSGFAWVMILISVLGTLGVTTSVFISSAGVVLWEELMAYAQPPPPPEVTLPVEAPVRDGLATLPPDDASDDENDEDDQDDEPSRIGELFTKLGERAVAAKSDATHSRDPPRPGRTRPAAPKKPEGPVLSVAEAKKQLEPEISNCLKAAGAHRVTARMGNKTVGGVAILTSASVAKPRVDGVVVALPKTKLGRCMNEAGRAVRTRAFGGNYIIIDMRNTAVADPLRDLPVQPSREALAEAVTPLEPAIKACAKKHGEQGRRAIIQLRIDGPSGKLLSVQPIYTARGFNRCIEPLYRGVRYPEAQTHIVQHQHKFQL